MYRTTPFFFNLGSFILFFLLCSSNVSSGWPPLVYAVKILHYRPLSPIGPRTPISPFTPRVPGNPTGPGDPTGPVSPLVPTAPGTFYCLF